MKRPHGECGAWDDIEAEQETALTMSSMLAGRWAFQKFCVQCGVCRAHRESLHFLQLRGNTKGGMKDMTTHCFIGKVLRLVGCALVSV